MVRLYELQALVHQARRVDRDLRPHLPDRVAASLFGRGSGEPLQGPVQERPAGGGQPQAAHTGGAGGIQTLQELEERVVLGGQRGGRARPPRGPCASPARPRPRAAPCWRQRHRPPRARAAKTGPSPSIPAMAATTRPAGRSAASKTAPGPAPHAGCSSFPAARDSAARASAKAGPAASSETAAKRAPWRTASCASSPARRRAVTASSWKRSGSAARTSNA